MLKKFFIAGVAAFSLAVVSPATAHDGNGITINGITFGDDDESFLDQLIALDAEEIEELREEMVEARAELKEAALDIEEAREEVKSVPGGQMILAAALKIASASVSEAVEEAFEEVKLHLNEAETELATRKSDLSAEEYDETSGAITMLRSEIVELEKALAEFVEEIRA